MISEAFVFIHALHVCNSVKHACIPFIPVSLHSSPFLSRQPSESGKLMNCECVPSAWRHPDGPSSLLSFALIINRCCENELMLMLNLSLQPQYHWILDLSWTHYIYIYIYIYIHAENRFSSIGHRLQEILIWYTWFYMWCGMKSVQCIFKFV